jgi:hypothetical protein
VRRGQCKIKTTDEMMAYYHRTLILPDEFITEYIAERRAKHQPIFF